VLGAADAGAPHLRERIWILADDVAHSSSRRRPTHELRAGRDIAGLCVQNVADALCDRGASRFSKPPQRKERHSGKPFDGSAGGASIGGWWRSEPAVGRVADGVASRVDRLTAIGNGQVPAVAALAWRTLMAAHRGTD
jgi:DNA (cytosine-5)-methyltransferase 1